MGLLYSGMKVFHYKEKLDSLAADRRDILPPVHIRIKPTNVCGHNCRYCAYRVDNLQLGRDMNERDFIPKEKMLEIIDDVIDMGVKAVTFSGGGDPFFYPHLLDVARRLAESPVKFASLTNGARLSGEVADVFARSATWLRVSIDGWDDDSYARYRGVRHGEFSRVMKNMEEFKARGGGCYLGVSLIVDRENAPHVYDFLRRLKDTGADSVKISPCIVDNEGAKNNAYHRPVFDIVKEQTARAMAELTEPGFEIYDSYHELDDKFLKDYTWCPYLQILPVIGADCNVYPCQDKAYNLEEGLVGSIKERRFKDFWFDGKEKFFKVNPSRVCNHHCVANAKNKMVLEYLGVDAGHLGFV